MGITSQSQLSSHKPEKGVFNFDAARELMQTHVR